MNNWFDNNFAKVFTFFFVISLTLSVIRNIFYVITSQSAAKNMFEKLNFTIMFSKVKFFDTNACGRIINRISNDTNTIDGNYYYIYI